MDSIKCPIVKSDSICYWKDMWQKLDRMRQLWQLCDVSLITVDNRLFMAHSPVLAASSNTLHDILVRQNQMGTNEETQKKVFLENVTSDVLEVTLNFIYGITPLSRLAFEMLQVGAKELGIMGAYEYCCDQLKNLSVQTPGTKEKGKFMPATMRTNSEEENLISYQWQIDEPSDLNGVDGQKCEFALAVSQSTCQVSHTDEMGLDAAAAAQGVNSIVCFPVNEPEPVADGKASEKRSPVDKVAASVSSDDGNCQSSIHNGMPSDEIHTAMFTQMSLGDLTAGVKCPHIKGIIGEDNPMDSFLVDNELVDETFKTNLQAEESDFDETPTLEEQSIDFSIRVPLKKRKRSSLRTSGNDREPESSSQSFGQIKSSEGRHLDECSDFQKFLERNAPVSSNDSSSHNCNLDLLSCFVSSNSVNSISPTCGPVQAALQRNCTKTLTLSSLDVLTPQNAQTDDTECVQSARESDSLQRRSVLLEQSPPGCRSSFHSCISSQNIRTDSIHDVAGDDLPSSQFSFNVNNSLLSTGMVDDLSNNLLVSQSPNTSPSFLCINKPRATSNNSLQSVGCQQVLGSVWQDGFASLKPCFTSPKNESDANKQLNWESVSICSRAPKLTQELALDLEPMQSLNVTPSCEQKVFTSFDKNFPKHGTIRPQHALSSSKDVDCTLSMHQKEILCFSTLGSCQAIAPNTMSRNHSIEICPSVANIAIPASTFQSSDETFPKDSLPAVATSHIQESYVSSSPESNGVSDLIRNGKCQCDLCDKAFKNTRWRNCQRTSRHVNVFPCANDDQLNAHRKRMHLQKYVEPSPTDDKSTCLHHCQYCQESFKSSYKLQTHQLKVHSKGKLFSCQDCSFRSPRKKDVQAHMLSQHGRAPFGVKVYSCSSCNYKCIDRNRFEEHEAKHTGITSHRCPLCSRAYTTKRGMRTHIKYHSEERPHKCNICGAAFKVTSKLSDHMKLIHIQKGVKPYKCGYCDHATALRGNCNQHIRKNHPGQPLFVIDKFASQRKCVKDYDYAGIAGEGIEEHGDLKAAKIGIQSSKMAVL